MLVESGNQVINSTVIAKKSVRKSPDKKKLGKTHFTSMHLDRLLSSADEPLQKGTRLVSGESARWESRRKLFHNCLQQPCYRESVTSIRSKCSNLSALVLEEFSEKPLVQVLYTVSDTSSAKTSFCPIEWMPSAHNTDPYDFETPFSKVNVAKFSSCSILFALCDRKQLIFGCSTIASYSPDIMSTRRKKPKCPSSVVPL